MGLSNHIYLGFNIEDIELIGTLCILDKTGLIMKKVNNILNLHGAREALITLEALNMGIIPAVDAQEMKKCLSSVPPDEKRKIQRKFRKIQRKLRKKHKEQWADIRYGYPGKAPNKFQKSARKSLVFSDIAMKVLND